MLPIAKKNPDEVRVESTSTTSPDDDDEWEEETMIVELNGVLDASSVRTAISEGQFALRRQETDKPIVQIGNALYTGKWARTIGTDLIFEGKNGKLELLASSDKMLKAEKALLTSEKTKEPVPLSAIHRPVEKKPNIPKFD